MKLKSNNKLRGESLPKKYLKYHIILLSFFLSVTLLPTMAQKRVKASYYANKFHGRLTASGKKFDMHKMTCAHKKYPFGTLLKVRNPKNDKEVVVEVTDRGPFIKGRSIDLSYAAAKSIGLIPYGVMTVEYEVIDEIPLDMEDVRTANANVVPLAMLSAHELLFHISEIPIKQIKNTKLSPFLVTQQSITTVKRQKKKCKNIFKRFLYFF